MARAQRLIAIRSIAAIGALCATTIHSNAGELCVIGIRLRVDPSITSRRITERLKQEAEAIWKPYGVRLEWTDAGDFEPAARASVEARLERELYTRGPTEWPAVLGRAVVKPEMPYWWPIRVSFDATERVLALRATGRSTRTAITLDRDLAGALGRVLAHEIGHLLLGAPYHDRAGLMRAVFDAGELAEPDRTPFRLTCSSVERLRSRLPALTQHSQLVNRDESASLHVEDVRDTRRNPPGGASCIGDQQAH